MTPVNEFGRAEPERYVTLKFSVNELGRWVRYVTLTLSVNELGEGGGVT